MNINQTILELRKERGLSQKSVADAVGISQSTIAKIEINRNEATASTIRKLADFFGVSADYLLGRSDEYLGAVPVLPTAPQLSAEEREIITMYASLPPAGKKLVRQTLETLTDTTSSAGSGQTYKKA